jgi:hypothetical protein
MDLKTKKKRLGQDGRLLTPPPTHPGGPTIPKEEENEGPEEHIGGPTVSI